jgi:peptidoglycan/xylan/chitin deacetylase (PgdA/CDA1 family)
VNGRTIRWLMSLAHRARPARAPRLTILRHHRVFADDERPLYRIGVSASVLSGQLAMLADLGLTPLTLSDGLARLAEGMPGRSVALTFDDGYADNVERALPIIEAHGGRATFYLTAGLMEERRAPWWDELVHRLERSPRGRVRFEHEGGEWTLDLSSRPGRAAALAALMPAFRETPERQAARIEALGRATGVATAAPCALASWDLAARLIERGMEVGAHTMNHPYLSLLDADRQRAEIAGSVRRVEERLGVRVRGLAYPGGDYDAATLEVVEALGLEHAVTTRAGDAAPDSRRHTLARRGLSDGACLGPGGRFSTRLARAEMDGAFDRLRRVEAVA